MGLLFTAYHLSLPRLYQAADQAQVISFQALKTVPYTQGEFD